MAASSIADGAHVEALVMIAYQKSLAHKLVFHALRPLRLRSVRYFDHSFTFPLVSTSTQRFDFGFAIVGVCRLSGNYRRRPPSVNPLHGLPDTPPVNVIHNPRSDRFECRKTDNSLTTDGHMCGCCEAFVPRLIELLILGGEDDVGKIDIAKLF